LPVETRWYRNEQWADLLYMLALAKIETGTVVTRTMPTYYAACRVGLKVYVDDLMIGEDVAVVEIPADTTAVYFATWTPPETSIDGKYVKVEVWSFIDTADEVLSRAFRTEVFSGQKLDALPWTCYYDLAYTAVIFPTPSSSLDFRHDGAYESRIEGFSYSPIVVVVPPRFVGNGLVWTVA